MKQQKTVVEVSILATESTGESRVKLKSGNVVSCALYENGDPSKPVNVKIEDSFGEEIHPFASHKNYKQTNGDYENSFKPIEIVGNQEIVVKARSAEAQTAKFTFQMIFNQIEEATI